MNVEVRGRGAPLVLLHGWGMNLRVFDSLADALAPHHEVHAVDLPGHGRSPFDPQRASFAQQVDALVSALPRAAVLVGWSLGGQFAMALAAGLQARGLVLISSTPKFVNGDGWTAGVTPSLLETFARQLEEDWQRTLEEFLALQVRGSADAARVLGTLRAALERHGTPTREALSTGLQLLAGNDLRALAPGIGIPALLIAGQHDRVTPPAAAQWLERTLPAPELLQIARAGHAPFLSHAALTCRQIAAFVETLG